MIDKHVTLIEQPDRWIIDVQELEVTNICIGYMFGLDFWSRDDSLYLQIEQQFLFKTKEREHILSPERGPEEVIPLLSVLHIGLRSAIVFKDGRLELTFTNGSELSVPASSNKYEAWNISGKNGFKFVSLPGGGLAVWPPSG